MKKILVGLLVLIIIFVGYTLISTGYFRSIESDFDGRIIGKVPIKGAEDMTISYEGQFMMISADDRASSSLQRAAGLYYLSLQDTSSLEPKLISDEINFPFFPHGISLQKKDSVTYQLLVVNHPDRSSSTIERFYLIRDSLVHIETLQDPLLFSANDVTIINEQAFYVTNDHGYHKGVMRTLEDYFGLAASYVLYFDGQKFSKVAEDIAYANGIHFDQANNQLLVAAPRAFEVKVFQVATDYSLQLEKEIKCGTGVDNIETDQNGDFWIGCHPNLLAFTAYAGGKRENSPSEVIRISSLESDNEVETIFLDDGEILSGASVAVIYQDLLFIGNVMDDHLLITRR